jgi:uncharacterized membrane protein YhaH (DUF805 family)
MTFTSAIKSVLKDNYYNFHGRASRSEYWFFFIFWVALLIVFTIIDSTIIPTTVTLGAHSYGLTAFLFVLLTFIPSLALAVRRLHDSNKTGWLVLINIIPLIGALVYLVLMALPGTEGTNKYGG